MLNKILVMEMRKHGSDLDKELVGGHKSFDIPLSRDGI